MYKESVTNSLGLTVCLGEIEPCLDYDGSPLLYCGAWAAVFKVSLSADPLSLGAGRPYALKCYLGEGGRDSNADYISNIDSDYLARTKYLDNELYVYNENGEADYFPVSVMEWIEGETLSRVIRRLVRVVNRAGDFEEHNLEKLRLLSLNFDTFALWLLDQPFAHGDIKGDNIIVDSEMNIKLVDYDNIYVPESCYSPSMVFSVDYQHPSRTSEDVGMWLDDYPLALISLSLHVLVESPELYSRLNRGENILFDPAVISSGGRAKKLKAYQIKQLDAVDMLRQRFSGQALGALLDAVCLNQDARIEQLRGILYSLKTTERTTV